MPIYLFRDDGTVSEFKMPIIFLRTIFYQKKSCLCGAANTREFQDRSMRL